MTLGKIDRNQPSVTRTVVVPTQIGTLNKRIVYRHIRLSGVLHRLDETICYLVSREPHRLYYCVPARQ